MLANYRAVKQPFEERSLVSNFLMATNGNYIPLQIHRVVSVRLNESFRVPQSRYLTSNPAILCFGSLLLIYFNLNYMIYVPDEDNKLALPA